MTHSNPNARLEAFCDGVFAIALTLLVIELKIPETEPIEDTAALWLALQHLAPAVFAFLLSFVVIFITWVNHHAAMKMVNASSPSFLFANGFLLFTVAALPFPTALLGRYVLTDRAAPAVSIYNAVLSLQAVGWLLLTSAVLANGLAKSEKARRAVQQNRRYGWVALAIYSLCTVAALRFPTSVAIASVVVWMFWLIIAIRYQSDFDAPAATPAVPA
jgi:uncharacterized membrane protein